MNAAKSKFIVTDEMKKSVPFQWAFDVRSGKITTGTRIKKAVDRFFRWIDEADDKGFYIDHARGMHIIEFFPLFLRHTKGKSAGERFVLSPWQQFTLYNLFGWMEIKFDRRGNRRDIRRINECYEKIAKKNGKTAVMAGVSLYCMAFDDEDGAEVYVGATKEAQAKLCTIQAQEFIRASQRLRHIGFRNYQSHIVFQNERLSATMHPLGGDSKTQDGINASLSILDEYHAHKDDSIKENLESSMASRRQPIVYHITTAGVNIHSVCKNYEDVCAGILDGIAENDHLLIMIHDLDEGDDWQDPDTWIKANPNMNVTVDSEFLKKELQKAINQPSKIPNFKTKHLNQWVDAPTVWIPNEIWMKGSAPVKMENFAKFGSVAGLDLSSTTDLSAFVIMSKPDEDGIHDLLPFFYCPKDAIETRSKEDRVPYRFWMDAGYLRATPGNVIDYDEIIKDVLINYRSKGIEHVEIDRHMATWITNQFIDHGIDVSYFNQAITSITTPTKEFERLVMSGKIRHGGNPILRWMLSGCVIYQDANENIKVHKGRSNHGKKRVDGIIAAIMALGGILSPEQIEQSKYNDPDADIYFGD